MGIHRAFAILALSFSDSLPLGSGSFSDELKLLVTALLTCALSFDDVDIRCDSPEYDLEGYDSPYSGTDLDPDDEIVSGGLPAGCLWEVLRRLSPTGLLVAAGVCKGWRERTKRLWRAAEELRLMVPSRGQLRFMGSVLKKCPSLVRLALKIERFGSKPTFDISNPLLGGNFDQESTNGFSVFIILGGNFDQESTKGWSRDCR
ncbi:hypothetical protein GQ457_17G019200 [Hibiscus cannabinus]